MFKYHALYPESLLLAKDKTKETDKSLLSTFKRLVESMSNLPVRYEQQPSDEHEWDDKRRELRAEESFEA